MLQMLDLPFAENNGKTMHEHFSSLASPQASPLLHILGQLALRAECTARLRVLSHEKSSVQKIQ